MDPFTREHQLERPSAAPPRIYVACLASYNAGRLFGAWIRADQEPDELLAEIAAMLARSPLPGAEEWAIHDQEGFDPVRLSEHEAIDTISRLATGIARHGPAFAHWAACAGTSTEALASFHQHYMGHWPSVEAFVEALLHDLGADLARLVPRWLQPYVRLDCSDFARDLASEIHIADGAHGIHVFTRAGTR
jgi:antirestriction protein